MLRSKFNALLNRTPVQWYYWLYRTFSSKRLQNFDSTHPCIFTLSTGRVGTKTLAALLNLTPNIFAFHEPKPALFGLSKLTYQHSGERLAQQILYEAFRTSRQEQFNYALNCYKGYAETSPQATFLAPIILTVIPGVKFIHLVRHPAQVVRSGMRRKWFDGHPSDSTRITPKPNDASYKQWRTFSQFKKNLWLWKETNRWILDFSAELPDESVLLLQSEKLFSGDTNTLKILFAFVEADMPPVRKIQKILGKKLNAQITGSFPLPSEWTNEMKTNLQTIAGDTARQLGYSL